MSERKIPKRFRSLLADGYIEGADIASTADGFFMVRKSIASILAKKGVLDFPDAKGERLACDQFFDDWFLYAAPSESDYAYSLLKMREQESDAKEGAPADGDTPGVTISFIAFDFERLLGCLAEPSDENRRRLNGEINRVVAYKGQRHHNALKRYFKNPHSQGAYLVAKKYVATIAAFASDGRIALPEVYKEIAQKSRSYKTSPKFARLPRFMDRLNRSAGRTLCDEEYIYLENKGELTEQEALAILATHAGNTSVHSFAAEVEYHARFLTPLARIKIPFFGRSIYDSAIRADMTVGDTEFEGPAPFYRSESKIVRRQYEAHVDFSLGTKKENNYD